MKLTCKWRILKKKPVLKIIFICGRNFLLDFENINSWWYDLVWSRHWERFFGRPIPIVLNCIRASFKESLNHLIWGIPDTNFTIIIIVIIGTYRHIAWTRRYKHKIEVIYNSYYEVDFKHCHVEGLSGLTQATDWGNLRW